MIAYQDNKKKPLTNNNKIIFEENKEKAEKGFHESDNLVYYYLRDNISYPY